ncbi:POT family proton-dependent oligopeptide transporter [Scopulibacillus daqui]|uniref:POT family proton-dependent oligopeptide transporter n=1 Tax=Scopulibacillus daqui TaxID=1469162 RepID=A0ABS2Q3G2_9BACL|nr:peptide MFS transporter [Scopulibacillus daqui]MBM7646219.1 POT family proton-dependent oligopeptide transporter [Scopulibacillus daqui]
MADDKQKRLETIPQTGFFGHPRGLATLFSIEFWERFSYYGMRAILLFYIYYSTTKGGLGLDKATAASIMSIYGSLVYMSSIIGGWLADRILGSRSTIIFGGLLIAFGHLVLSIPGSVPALYVSMALIILGSGILKPNLSNIVGDLYSKTDYRRDAGFSIFYAGANAGSLLAPLIVGTVGQVYSFHLGFAIAAVGMIIGLIWYILTSRKTLGQAGRYVPNPLTTEEKSKVFIRFGIGAIVIIILLIATIPNGLLTINRFTYVVSGLGVVIPLAYFIVMYTSKKTTQVEKSRLIAYIPLFITAICFWSIQEQGSTIFSQVADSQTKLDLGWLHIQSSWFQSINPLYIVILAPVFAVVWTKLGKRQPSTPVKFSIGVILAGISFLIMVIPFMSGTDHKISPLWLVVSFLFVTLGELFLSPVGASATTKLAPAAFASQTMSVWYLSNASAQAINAQLVKLFNANTEILYFTVIGIVSIVIGIILLFLSKKIHSLMSGVD